MQTTGKPIRPNLTRLLPLLFAAFCYLCALPMAHAQTGALDFKAGFAASEAKDYSRALLLYERAAHAGSAEAAHNMGFLYETGRGVKVDLNEAFKWFKLGAEGGNVISMRSVGTNYSNGIGVALDLAEGARWFRRSADLNDAESMVALGRMTANGHGMPVDRVAAVALYEKAAALKNADAMTLLGYAHTNGLGVPVDAALGEKWNTLGAEYGDPMGARNIAATLWSRDPWAAKAYMELAAHLGEKTVSNYFKTIDAILPKAGREEYDKGLAASLAGDKSEAFKWMSLAMQKGNYMAGSFVVEAYMGGRGTTENAALARQKARVCATIGNDNCQTILAQYLARGTEGNQDPEGARIQYERAALQGNTLAMFLLAEMYDKAQGISR